MEKLQIVHPENGEPTGELQDRSEAIANQSWCRSTNIFVLNAKGEVLCHRRSPLKERHPNAWSTHLGGHVTEGESFLMNAVKELQEESGIVAHERELLPWRTTKMAHARLWVREFILFSDLDVSALVPQPGEVEEFAWIAPAEIIRRAKEEPGNWLIGTHDFVVEYQCMRAALTAAHAIGAVRIPDPMRHWSPLSAGT